MQLPDEAISYNYQSLLIPPGEEWTAAAELRSKHFLNPQRIKDIARRVEQAKSQAATEREVRTIPADQMPVDSAFIDLPQNLLDPGFQLRFLGVCGLAAEPFPLTPHQHLQSGRSRPPGPGRAG